MLLLLLLLLLLCWLDPSNGYKFALDGAGRVTEVSGPVSLLSAQSKGDEAAQMVYATYWLSTEKEMESSEWEIGHIVAKQYDGAHDSTSHHRNNTTTHSLKHGRMEGEWNGILATSTQQAHKCNHNNHNNHYINST